MNTAKLNFYVQPIVFLICFFISAANSLGNSVFQNPKSMVQNSRLPSHQIARSPKSAESKTIIPGEIPVGLDASAWYKIQKQIRDQKSNTPIILSRNMRGQRSITPSLMAPVFSSEEKLTASDAQPNEQFGWAVAVAGDVAIIGAKDKDSAGSNAGAAYIFERNTGTTNVWGQVKKLTASDAQMLDYFGGAVGVKGDVAIVGAGHEDTSGAEAGAAYIFERDSGGINAWGEVKKLMASDAQAGDQFGYSVSIAGDVAVVGAYKDDDGGTNSGAVYIFERNYGGVNAWGEVKKLTASDAQENDDFGISVAVWGDVIVVGVRREDDGGSDSGAAYIFERNSGGINFWGETKKLLASDAQAGDNFGWSVAVEGDVALVGAYLEDDGDANAGAAYIFERNADGINTWGEVKKLTAHDAQGGDYFGRSVSMAGDIVIVGADGEDDGGSFAGAAYIFARNAGGVNGWEEVKKLTATDAQAGNRFGHSVAVAGGVAFVGANGDDDKGSQAGAAYVLPVSHETKEFKEAVKKISSDAQLHGHFGWAVAVDGDVAVIGAKYEDAVGNDSGAAYILERNIGGVNAWGEVKKLTASDAQNDDQFGISVAVAGDVAVVGAYLEDAGGFQAGAAYVFERNTGGINAWGEVKKLVASDAEEGDTFGFSVAMAGDVALIGASTEDENGFSAGAAYIFERNAGGINAWGEVKKLIASDTQQTNRFGYSVAVDGDVAIIGARNEGTGGTDAGAAYIFERNTGGINAWGEVKKLIASDAQESVRFGSSVAVAGDIAVIGALFDNAEGPAAGAAYVFERNADGINSWGEVKKLIASDADANDQFGDSVAVAGDIVVVGAHFEDAGLIRTGAAYIFERNAGGTNAWGEIKKLSASDAQEYDYFGDSVAVAGDVVVIGAYIEDEGATNAGAVYFFEKFIPSTPQIATNALIFPSAGAILLAPSPTNILWNFEKITDDFDGTNLMITKISVHIAETTNEVSIVTNNIYNFLGQVPWFVPENLWGGNTNYVLKFEVVNSSSLTNSRTFWDNEFTIIPEPLGIWIMIVLGVLFIKPDMLLINHKSLFSKKENHS